MLMVSIVYATGVLLADQLPISCPVFPVLLAATLLAGAALIWTRLRSRLIWLLLLLTGAANLICNRAILSPHDLRRLAGAEPRIAQIRGSLRETPYHRAHERGEEQTWRTLAEISVSAVKFSDDAWQSALGRVLVSTPGLLPEDYYGGRDVEIDGVLRLPRLAAAEGVFDYRAYLERQGIYYQLLAASSNAWTLLPPPTGNKVWRRPMADRFGDWAKAVLARGLPAEDRPLQLLWTMTLGWKTALSGEVAEPFMRSGTMHVFAISGLHIALIAGLLVTWLRVFRLPRWLCGWIVIPLVWAYTGVTGWQASAVRSTIMATVILFGWSLRRPSDLINSLAVAALCILLWDPQQLFQASFQLSFSVVLSLAVLTPVLDRFRQRRLAPNPLQPEKLRPRWHKWIWPPLEYLTASLTVSLAAWLGSLPLIAWYFHLITPVSLPANLVVVPLSSAALACNLASLATNSWLSGATELFNHSAWFFMVLMIRASEWAAQFPGGVWQTQTPSPGACALYYAFLVASWSGQFAHEKNRRRILPPLLFLSAAVFFHWLAERSWDRLTVLGLNGGEALYFEPAFAGPDLLVDCGDGGSAEFVVKPFLRGRGVNRLDQLLLTHGDVHNVGGLPLIRQHFAPRHYYLSNVPFRSTAYRGYQRALQTEPDVRRLRTVADGDWIG
ncbi:MAG TPA: ComEC/Rec2 family competence protein, partial [Candidatus Dormibacteraeota bacterium]|nr:ComEC/Rec2 family competence protein [Candidatus Dormibacteraeota bacterium]